jgi:site-specific DNA recombinase
VVWEFDRLARNTRDAIEISDRLQKAGADLASVTEGINTRGPMGRAFYQLSAVFAEFERNQIRERTSAAMRHHQAKGQRMGRADRCPYGKQPDFSGSMIEGVDKAGEKVLRPARLIDNSDELVIIDRICREREAGRGLRAIGRALDQAGIACRGSRWSHSIIRSIQRRADQ